MLGKFTMQFVSSSFISRSRFFFGLEKTSGLYKFALEYQPRWG